MPFRDARIFKLDKAHLSKFADVSPQEAKEVEIRLYKEGIVKTSLWDFEFMPHSNRVCATRAYFPPELSMETSPELSEIFAEHFEQSEKA